MFLPRLDPRKYHLTDKSTFQLSGFSRMHDKAETYTRYWDALGLFHHLPTSTPASNPIDLIINMNKKFRKLKEKLGLKGSRHLQADRVENTPRLVEGVKVFSEPIARGGPPLIEPQPNTTGQPVQNAGQRLINTAVPLAKAGPSIFTTAESKPDNSFNKSDLVQIGWTGFKLTLNALKEVSAAFPPLQAAVGGLVVVIEKIDQTLENSDNFKAMNEQLSALAGFIGRYERDSIHPNVRDRLEGLAQSIEKRTEFIKERTERGTIHRFINASDDANDIVNSLRELTFAVQLFQMDSTENTRQVVTDLHQRELLKILDAVGKAPYNASGRTGCMDGTRLDTLSRLFAWAADPNGERVLWLSGMAGIGKSAIAISFCKAMAVQGRLGGSFFCFRQSHLLNDVKRILPTIAFQFARRFEAYRQALVQIMEETSYTSYSYLGLDEQAKDLFIELLEHLKTAYKVTLVVVIDALDECSSYSAVKDFLRVVLRSDLPLKFLITSRPETHIEKGFSHMGRSEIDDVLAADEHFRQELLSHASLRLHDVEEDIVEGDISRYLTRRLSNLFDSVDQADITALAKRSGKLFIFAFTAVQHISAGVDSNLSMAEIKQRFSMIIGDPVNRPSALSMQTIDALYARIFESAYINKEITEKVSLRGSLDTLLCLREPQSTSVIAGLVDKQPYDVRSHLANFRSVLDIPKDNNVPVFTFHASFLDYVLDDKRSEGYTLDAGERHEKLALACLQLMNTLLHEDMCGIMTRQTPNADTVKAVIREKISPSLRYACVSWAWHLKQCLQADFAHDVSPIIGQLKLFVDHHILHWLECLSLIQDLRVALDAPGTAQQYLSRHDSEYDGGQRATLADAQRMVLQSYDFLQEYALEVYASAVAWLPVESSLRSKYGSPQGPEVLHGLAKDWGSCLQVLKAFDQVDDVAYSPNGSYVAVGTGRRVEIWDAETGQMYGKLDGHTVWVKSVSFSPDGHKLASGSQDGAACIWDMKTSVLLAKLEGHSNVTSMAFSPDGSLLASASGDKIVRIWVAETGKLQTQLEGHLHWVTTVAFSPYGSKLASGSYDGAVCMWNVETRVIHTKLEGHTGGINCIAFSPNGSKLASASQDRTVCIWDMETGAVQKRLDGHAAEVTSVTFSPDGTKLASGSWDQTICIWDADTGVIRTKLEGHGGRVMSVVFSPDGSKMASGSGDKTVRIWDVKASVTQTNVEGHADRVTSVAFALDGSKLASGSRDKTVCVWDLGIGIFQEKLEGHGDAVTAIAISPDGSKLASGSRDRTVCVWDVATGLIQSKLQGHSLWLTVITFSFDGSKLASGSGDGIVCTWDVETGVLRDKLDGHKSSITALIFSPDGFKLASESRDKTVCIWDFEVGSREHELKAVSVGSVPPEFISLGVEPSQEYFFSDDHKSVVAKTDDGKAQPVLWILSDYRANISQSAIFKMYAVIGYKNGRVIVLKLNHN